MAATTLDQWDEAAEGVPGYDEPFIQQFLRGREALIVQEKRQRSDHSFRQTLSPIAKEACNIVERIRREEQETIWTSEVEDQLAHDKAMNVHPGMMFFLAKGRMEKTNLWKIVRRMPKGALLHCHMDAMVDFDFIFEKLLETPGMHVHCEHDLSTPTKRGKALLEFSYKKDAQADGDIWSRDYKPNVPITVTKVADTFPDGGRPAFLKWLRSRFTITELENLDFHHGVDAIWRKFTSVFAMINSIIFYEPIFRAFLQRLLTQLAMDGVKWVEFRISFPWTYFREGSEVGEDGFDQWFTDFKEILENFKASDAGKEFWGARIIWTGIRRFEPRAISKDMDTCITMKIQHPDLIAGYDLVGQEDGGYPLKDLLPQLFWFQKQCVAEGVELPFFFHAGECLGDGNETDQNLFDALLLGTRRIGHGFSLYKHPLLIDMVKDKKILVESCPISNEVLRLCSSIMTHPLPALLARGVPCALCNDDPAILGHDTAGMTHDFWQALQGWDNLGLAGLASLAENSVRWSAFEDQNKNEWVRGIKEASMGDGVRAQRLQEWATEFEKFCLWVVSEFGEDAEH